MPAVLKRARRCGVSLIIRTVAEGAPAAEVTFPSPFLLNKILVK